jgi:hypothetical protein
MCCPAQIPQQCRFLSFCPTLSLLDPRQAASSHQPQSSVFTSRLSADHSLTGLSLSLTLRPTVSWPVYLGIKHPSRACDQIFISARNTEYVIRLTVTFLILWGALSDDRMGLSFVCAAGPCQRSLSQVLFPWDLRPYFTVSDLRLPFSSPPTTRRVTVEVFDPASTRVELSTECICLYI